MSVESIVFSITSSLPPSLSPSSQNYNKSRIHSSRGAREVELHLDGKLIFRGEIARYLVFNITSPPVYTERFMELSLD